MPIESSVNKRSCGLAGCAFKGTGGFPKFCVYSVFMQLSSHTSGHLTGLFFVCVPGVKIHSAQKICIELVKRTTTFGLNKNSESS